MVSASVYRVCSTDLTTLLVLIVSSMLGLRATAEVSTQIEDQDNAELEEEQS